MVKYRVSVLKAYLVSLSLAFEKLLGQIILIDFQNEENYQYIFRLFFSFSPEKEYLFNPKGLSASPFKIEN